jgi:hypothetical protein
MNKPTCYTKHTATCPDRIGTTFTFYTLDDHNGIYLRLAIIESVGLMYKIGNDVFVPLYKDNLYYVKGSGKRRLARASLDALRLEKY